MLPFIDDESYRRQILVQLNCGKLRQRYCDIQENQLGALGLVVNLIVLRNTIYIKAALNQLRA